MVEVSFVSALELLRRMGFFQIVLPTFLVYAIVYGVLDRTNVFGMKQEKGKNVPKKELNSVVAFVIALLFVGAANLLDVMTAFIPYIGLLSVIFVSFVMLAALAFGDFEKLLEKEWYKQIMLGVTAFAFVFSFGLAAGWWSFSSIVAGVGTGAGLFSAENLSVMIFLVLIVGAIAWIWKSTSQGESGGSS
ncbi:hypothetical protein COT72_03405 [archaeon CG10_big_fil_rev_8_21_14_0_10_43_11]|nr:MAG: hypothetical protein COT72_03405 [archaeon CG10_big_fil_rev_8_21_14_0_10_43_11]